MKFKDYYKVLGVERDATQDEIKRAYRKLARKYHPDVSKEARAEDQFKELGEAYEVLKDPEKRAAYDQLGADWKAGQDFRAPPDWDAGFEWSGDPFAGDHGGVYSDFFESLFGREFRAARGRPARDFKGRGQDHHARVLLDLEDAIEGVTRSVTLRVPQADAEGRLSLKERTLRVRIPKGITSGQHIRLAGQGAPGLGGGGAGDLYLQVEFKPHPVYRIDSRDLYLELPVTPWEAALGASVPVPTPAGTVAVKVPAGSASGKQLRLKGRGMQGKPAGDLYATLRIALPPADTAEARALYRKMQQELEFNPRAHLGV